MAASSHPHQVGSTCPARLVSCILCIERIRNSTGKLTCTWERTAHAVDVGRPVRRHEMHLDQKPTCFFISLSETHEFKDSPIGSVSTGSGNHVGLSPEQAVFRRARRRRPLGAACATLEPN
jgi:hypothetical protein